MKICIHHHTPTRDAEHWISTENGSHILIEGEGGNFKVIGGAGGKMNGNYIGPTSMSKSRIGNEGQTKKQVPIAVGHERLEKPLKIKRETEKAYGVENGYEEAVNTAKYDPKELTYAQREILNNRKSLEWLPKSHTSANEGYVHGMSGWLAKKHGYSTNEGENAKEERFNAGKEKYAKLLAEAKAIGVKGVRVGMRAKTIIEKIAAHKEGK